MLVRKTLMSDLESVLEIYEYARSQMKLKGNPNQWKDNNPRREIIIEDINNCNSYVVTKNDKIVGVFSFIIGPDSTYQKIDGSWLNDKPYGTIHRLASLGVEKGIFKTCLDFCESKISNIKVDTHHDNLIMQHLITKHGFTLCGIIYVADGSKRLAYQKEIKK